MIVVETTPPLFETDTTLAGDAEKEGYKWSFINRERYSVFDRETFMETLIDWGFFGPRDKRPSWWDRAADSTTTR